MLQYEVGVGVRDRGLQVRRTLICRGDARCGRSDGGGNG